MRNVNSWQREQTTTQALLAAKDFSREASEICETALQAAKTKLHPLLRTTDLNQLNKRSEFLQAFQSALERRIARKIASWQPTIQSIFRYDESHATNDHSWDGKIHLLVKVPCLSNAVKIFGRRLDKYLLVCLMHVGWSRFQKQQSILDLQQVTVNELRHGVGYGAMFCAVHSVPAQVWPVKR